MIVDAPPLIQALERIRLQIAMRSGMENEELKRPFAPIRSRHHWNNYLWAVALVAAATGLAHLVRILLLPADVVMVYLLAVMLAAFRLNRGSALVAAALAGAAYNFFFVPPILAFSVQNVRHFLSFTLMFIISLAVSALASRLRSQEEEARVREKRTAALYSLTRELAAAADEEGAAGVVTHHAAELFACPAAVLLRGVTGDLKLIAGSDALPDFPEQEMAAARWAVDRDRPAGRWTETFAESQATFFPLPAGSVVLGILALFRLPSRGALKAENLVFLEAFARQSAIAIERARLTEKAKAAAVRIQAEQMRSTLLSAVSHDLRTPLGAITGAGTALRDDRDKLGPEQQAELFDTICTEAERMDRLVSNILDMVRLESGGSSPRLEWVLLEEIVGSALSHLDAQLAGREVKLELPEDMPFVYVDPVLLEQVFVNLIENALKYAGPRSPVEIRAKSEGREIQVEVADRGPGLAAGEEERVFEKFYRGPNARAGGVGLGLSICRSIVKAHGGSITAENQEGGGAVFRIELPVPESPPPPSPPEDRPLPDVEEEAL
jgi:two-component system sensor histidine kinase KdpD